MRILASIRYFTSGLFHRAHIEHELDDRPNDFERSGLSRDEAERRARIEFGGQERFKEECRDQRGGYWLETLWADRHHGLRMLRKSQSFTLVAVLTLALALGATL